jgi:hypothetical protein
VKKREYRSYLDRLSLTQGEASELMRVTDRTGRRYAGGGHIPFSVAALLRAIMEDKISIKWLEELKD